MSKLDDSFLVYASDIIGDTNQGLSGYKIAKYLNSYAIEYNKAIPYASYPFNAYNKRTALYENLKVFEAVQQFRIISELCNLSEFVTNEAVQELKIRLYTRYPQLATEKISTTELVQKTRHWLDNYPDSLQKYNEALAKFEGGIFQRNTLDDMRLSFEMLVKKMLSNEKSLENQIPELGRSLDTAGASVELRNMVTKIINYYTDFQNHHVKHDDKVNENEVEFIIELTSVVMKFLIKMIG